MLTRQSHNLLKLEHHVGLKKLSSRIIKLATVNTALDFVPGA